MKRFDCVVKISYANDTCSEKTFPLLSLGGMGRIFTTEIIYQGQAMYISGVMKRVKGQTIVSFVDDDDKAVLGLIKDGSNFIMEVNGRAVARADVKSCEIVDVDV